MKGQPPESNPGAERTTIIVLQFYRELCDNLKRIKSNYRRMRRTRRSRREWEERGQWREEEVRREDWGGRRNNVKGENVKYRTMDILDGCHRRGLREG